MRDFFVEWKQTRPFFSLTGTGCTPVSSRGNRQDAGVPTLSPITFAKTNRPLVTSLRRKIAIRQTHGFHTPFTFFLHPQLEEAQTGGKKTGCSLPVSFTCLRPCPLTRGSHQRASRYRPGPLFFPVDSPSPRKKEAVTPFVWYRHTTVNNN